MIDLNTTKMSTETNDSNTEALRTIIGNFYLTSKSEQQVLDAIDTPPMPYTWTQEFNGQHRLFIPTPSDEYTDEGFKTFYDNLVNSNNNPEAIELAIIHNSLTHYETWRSGMFKGEKLFRWLRKNGMDDDRLAAMTTARQTSDTFLVVSKNPMDWIFMSTNQAFSSCVSLTSSYNDAHYFGLPFYMVCPSTFLVFLTNGKVRNYTIKGQSFKHFRMINRSVALFTQDNQLEMVRYYPNMSHDFGQILNNNGIPASSNYSHTTAHPQPMQDELYHGSDEIPPQICRPYLDFDSGRLIINRYQNICRQKSKHWEEGFEACKSITNLFGHRGDGTICAWCNKEINRDYDDYYYMANDDIVCEGCYEAQGFNCDSCNESYHEDDGVYVESHGYYCDYCYNEIYTQCYHCDTHIRKDEATYNEVRNPYCGECIIEENTCCDGCDEWIGNNYIINTKEDEHFCSGCINLDHFQCEECGEWAHKSEKHSLTFKTVCPDCLRDEIEEEVEALGAAEESILTLGEM